MPYDILGFLAGAAGWATGILGFTLPAEEKADAAQEDADNAAKLAAAEQAAFDAQWQWDMEQARRESEKLARQAEQVKTKVEQGFSGALTQMELSYGTEGKMGSEWAGYQNMLLQNTSLKGQIAAGAGASGLKNTGTVAEMQSETNTSIASDEAIVKNQIETGMNLGITTMKQDYTEGMNVAREIELAKNQLDKDWMNYDWNAFSPSPLTIARDKLFGDPDGRGSTGGSDRPSGFPGGNMGRSVARPRPGGIGDPFAPQDPRNKPVTTLQRLYAAKKKAGVLGGEMRSTQYQNAADELKPNFWTFMGGIGDVASGFIGNTVSIAKFFG